MKKESREALKAMVTGGLITYLEEARDELSKSLEWPKWEGSSGETVYGVGRINGNVEGMDDLITYITEL